MTVSNFQELSLNATRRFLQSVVVVDDEAYLDKKEPAAPKPVERPKRGTSLAGEEEKSVGKAQNALNAKELIDGFAEDGLVCAVLKPRKGQGIKTKVDKATQRADIVILDWKLFDSYGELTLEFIKKIISSDSSEKDRIRLIAIYTGESDLFDISSKVKDILSEAYGAEKTEVSGDKYTLDAGPTRVVLFSKGSEGLSEEHLPRVVSIQKLPIRVVLEFSDLCSGLLSNAALAALGEIRDITHRVIGKFSRDLDEAYLNHRALTVPVDEAETHVVPLIASEIQDALEGRGVHEYLSKEAIAHWFEDKAIDEALLSNRMEIKEDAFPNERMLAALQRGAIEALDEDTYSDKWSSILTKIRNGNKNERGRMTKCLVGEDDKAEKADRKLSVLMSMRSRYEIPPPTLRLGSIISELTEEGACYYLCIQPACDCVRVPKDGRDFSFLKLPESSNGQDVHLVIPDGEYADYRVNFNPYESEIIRFKAKKLGMVIAKDDSDNWVFWDHTGRRCLKWVVDLKESYAHRIANKYAAQVSRVGLTESEWLRRGSKD